MKKLSILIAFILSAAMSYAVQAPRPVGGDARIKIINYKPNTVFKFVGHYEYQSIIEFADDEVIDTITMGTPTPWQLVPNGNRIFLKPVENDATTNMTVITNKRMYFFEMHAETAQGIDDGSLNFVMKFVYPEQYQAALVQQQPGGTAIDKGPDLSKPERYNFEYTIAGDAVEIEPLQVFDDGEFTYIKFRDINAEIPAIFMVHPDSTESLVNFRFKSGYVIIEQVASKFTLRHGGQVICLFNKQIERVKEQQKQKIERKKANIL